MQGPQGENATKNIFTFLGSSFFFGLSALLILQTRDELDPVLDENNQLPDIVNFGAPIIVLILAAVISLPQIRKYLTRFFV